MRAVLLVAAVVGVGFACGSESPRPVAPPPVVIAPVPVVAARVPDPAPPALRLPGDVRPERVGLELTIVPDRPAFSGSVRIPAQVVKPTRVVWLNATELAIERATLDGKPARVIDGKPDFIGLTVERELPPGPLTIELAFTGAIDTTRSRGIYSDREGNDSYVYTFFESLDARRAFPCFDEPIYKVPWQVTLHVPAAHVALGNAPVVKETAEGELKRVELDVTRPLPSYLVAFVVGPFEVVDGGSAGRGPTPIRFVIPRGRASELGYARQVTPKVVAALEDYFDMAYPYGKLDVAVVPRYWGTMEHPGIVAMGQPLTLIRPEEESRERKRGYAVILSHELSHYWFGDLVTMAWWDDTWLNEALGQWSDLNITEAAEPTWRVRDDRVDLAVRGMTADETLAVQAIRQPAETKEAIASSFDSSITYYKGSSVFRMIEAFVGRDAWRDFIRSYMRAHAWGHATADEMFVQIAETFGPATATSLRSFLEQPGVPRIASKLRCEAGQPPRLWLSQQRALPAGVSDPTTRLWSLPVCVRYGDAKSSGQQCVSLSAPAVTVDLTGMAKKACPTWLLTNADAVGYYRSTVDVKTARALLTPASPIAKIAKASPAERMMLIEDLRAAVSRDELALDKLLELVPVIAADPDDKVARSAVLTAQGVPLGGLDEQTYAATRRWLGKTFKARATQLGWRRGAKDSEERHALRRALVPMIANDDPALGAEAGRLAERWLTDRSGLEDDMVAGALAVAARHGDAHRYARYVAALQAARDGNERRRLIAALGSFGDPAIADKALALLIGGELDLRDSLSVVYGTLYMRDTRDVALAFLAAHLDELLGKMRSDDAAGFLGGIAGMACDSDRRAKVAGLVARPADTIEGAKSKVARGLELSDQCIARVQRELPALKRVIDAK